MAGQVMIGSGQPIRSARAVQNTDMNRNIWKQSTCVIVDSSFVVSSLLKHTLTIYHVML
jgi:hypothetical protein